MLKKTDKYLLLILLLALIVRLIGIDHGFPFIFHPDEPAVVRSATGIRFDLNPEHFDWPHLHFYLNFLLYGVFAKFRGLLQQLGMRETIEGLAPILWRDPLVFYLISRVFDAILGALTVIPIYMAVKNLFRQNDEQVKMKKDFDLQVGFPRAAGLFAALALAIAPYHVHASHYALIDVPMLFWFAWAFYFSTKIFFSNNLNNYLLAGLFVGLSISTKYNGVMASLLVVSAHFYRVWRSEEEVLLSLNGWSRLVASGAASVFGFLLGTPFALLDYSDFLRADSPKGALWQFENVGKVGLQEQLYQLYSSLKDKLADDFGYTFLIVYLATIATALFKKHAGKLWFFLIPSVIIFFYISGAEKIRSHYFMPAYPFVFGAVGYLSAEIWSKFYSKARSVIIAILLVIFMVPAYFTVIRIVEFAKPDSRQALYEWMQAEIDVSEYLAYNTDDLEPVIEKFSDNKQGKGYLKDEIKGNSGLIIVALDYIDDTQDDRKLEATKEGNVPEDLLQVYELLGNNALPIQSWITRGNKGKYTGPDIFIYRFDYTE